MTAQSYQIPPDLLDLEGLEKKVKSILNAELYWFPVRHHSPTVARLLQQVIRERKPKILFIEAPADCNDLIPHIIDKKTKPPIALYSSYRDDNNVLNFAGIQTASEDIPARFASWYPMLSYSPEYVALQTAQEIKAKVCFIDLPHYAGLKPFIEDEEDFIPLTAEPEQALITQSEFYQALAESAGFGSWDEAWDSLFEFGAYNQDPEKFRYELATFCAAVRLTIPEEKIVEDGTYEREAYMRYNIQKELKKQQLSEADAMVICGGLHLFMDLTETDFPTPPEGTVYHSLVPYSFFRVSDLSGYGAGNRAPQFYQSYWNFSQKNKIAELLPHYIVSIVKEGRNQKQNLSPADAISIMQHSAMLAQLRQRQSPILEDVYDAVMACCCKGNPEEDGLPLAEAIDKVNIGRLIGKVTDQVGRLPLVIDFYYWLHKLKLDEFQIEEKQIKLTLNKQEAEDRQKSAFLHRLVFLGIPAAKLINEAAFSHHTIFKEHWKLAWSPKIDDKLISENLYGDTIETATIARIQEAIAEQSQNASACCQILYQAMNMEIPALIQQLEVKTANAIAQDPSLVSLAQALNYLTQINQIATLRQTHQAHLHKLSVQAYERACFAILATITIPEEQQIVVVEALKIIAEAVFKDKTGDMDLNLFITNIQSAVNETEIVYLRGAFQGLLAELKVISSDSVLQYLAAYSQAPPDILIQAGSFLEGMLSVSRTSLLTGSPKLIEAMESLFKYAEHEQFLVMLPQLRSAFNKMAKQSKLAIADKVAQHHGLKESTKLLKLNTSVEAAVLISKIDAEVHQIMQAWDF